MDYIKSVWSAMKKNMFVRGLCLAAIFGGLGCYMYFKDLHRVSKQRQETTIQERLDKQLAKDMFMIGYISYDEDKILSLNDWDRIFRIVNKHNIICTEQLYGDLISRRIGLLNKENVTRQNYKEKWYSRQYRELARESH